MSSERAFLKLSSRPSRREAEEFLGKLKTSAPTMHLSPKGLKAIAAPKLSQREHLMKALKLHNAPPAHGGADLVSSRAIRTTAATPTASLTKKAGLLDSAKGLASGSNLAAALGGAALATGIEYAINKRRAAHPGESKRPEAAAPGASFGHDLASTTAGAHHDFQEMAARHPAMAAPMAAPAGALIGLAALKVLQKLKGV